MAIGTLTVFQSSPTLSEHFRHRLPHNRLIVGLWDPALEADRISEGLSTRRPDRVVTNLAETLAIIREWQIPNVYPELSQRIGLEI